MHKKPADKSNDDDYETIYRTSITTRNGVKLFAWQFGLKAFRLRIRRKKK